MANGPHILVIEDNPDNRKFITDLLDTLNFQVLEAQDGNEGMDIALREKPALILMDLSLPEKDGWQATRELKANNSVSHIPIIALTAHAMLGDRERALETGCDDYITKPINMMELTTKLKKYLRE